MTKLRQVIAGTVFLVAALIAVLLIAAPETAIAVPLEADLAIIEKAFDDPPAEINVSDQVPVTVRTVVTNNGPAPVVDAFLLVTAQAQAGCDVTPVGPTRIDIPGLEQGEQREILENFTIHCSEPSLHSFWFDNELHVDVVGVTDPDLGNNVRDVHLDVASRAFADVVAVRKDVFIGGVLVSLPHQPDDDLDGLSNLQEDLVGSNPNNHDGDGDGFSDPDEVFNSSDPNDSNSIPPHAVHSDNDELSDLMELGLGTCASDPCSAIDFPNAQGAQDSDGDGVPDGKEWFSNSDPRVSGFTPGPSPDSDEDGLTDFQEGLLGTDPNNRDSDGDERDDNHEFKAGSDPNDPDSIPPNEIDTDNDGLSDVVEALVGTDPNNPDHDGDGFHDGHEFHDGSDPIDPDSTPPERPSPKIQVSQRMPVLVEEELLNLGDRNRPGLDFGPVQVEVWERLQPHPECDVSFHVRQDFRDAVTNLRIVIGGLEVAFEPAASSEFIAGPGQELQIHFQVALPLNVPVVLLEDWDIHCAQPSHHHFNLNKEVHTIDPHVRDPLGHNNHLHENFNVQATVDVDVVAVRKDVFLQDGAFDPADNGTRLNLDRADRDRDGLHDNSEGFLGTDPDDGDSDGDGFGDGHEFHQGSNPRPGPAGKASTPPQRPAPIEVPINATATLRVVEEIRLDATTTPPGFGLVPIHVHQQLHGQEDCALSFHVTQAFRDKVKDLLILAHPFETGGILAEDSEAGDIPVGTVAVAPRGHGLEIVAALKLEPGETLFLDELWDFSCTNPSHHHFNLHKNVHTLDQHIIDRNEDDNHLNAEFEVAVIAETDIAVTSLVKQELIQVTVGEFVTIPVTLTAQNNGPFGPVDIDTTLAQIAPPFPGLVDTDLDTVVDVRELQLFSDPGNASSTPEVSFFGLGDPFAGTFVFSCEDGLDNDGDGDTDGADTGCKNSDGATGPDLFETFFGGDPDDPLISPEHVFFPSSCNDGIDNDGDGLADAAEADGPDPGLEADCSTAQEAVTTTSGDIRPVGSSFVREPGDQRRGVALQDGTTITSIEAKHTDVPTAPDPASTVTFTRDMRIFCSTEGTFQETIKGLAFPQDEHVRDPNEQNNILDNVITVECVPPPPARTIGYWKNHQEHLERMLALGPIDLGDTLIDGDLAQALKVLKNSDAKDARNALRAQLLAAIFNLRNGANPAATGGGIQSTVDAAVQFLGTHPDPVDKKHPDRQQAIDLKDLLDTFNNSGGE